MKRRSAWTVLAVALCLASCRRPITDLPEHLTPAQVANRAKPATVEVIAVFNTHGRVPRADLNIEHLKMEVDHLNNPYDDRHDKAVKLFGLLLSDPGTYLREGETAEFNKKVAALGTGFIVTPNGYILTNAHVVKPDEDDLKNAVIESLAEMVDADARSVQQAFNQFTGDQIDEERLDRLKKALAEFYVKNIDLDTSKNFYIVMPSEPGNSAATDDPIPAEILKAGDPVPGKDIAVLKIDGTDLPTLPLAPPGSEAVQTGSDLLIDGYPGDVAFNTSYTLSSRRQPTLTRGLVSGTRVMATGLPVIQTDAAINHGNSGGPAMNDSGEVVGLATFGQKDTQGVNFAVAIDVARPFLDSLNIKPEQGSFTRDYNAALAEYDLPGHGNALAQFTDLHARYPNIGTVSEFFRQLSRENGNANDSTAVVQSPSGRLPIPLLLIGAVVLAGILIMVITTGRR